jgi:hypothetical protein
MSDRPRRPRRRLPWTRLLLPFVLLLLAVAAVVLGQRYWHGLHDSVGRMQASMQDARRRQDLLAAQVRVAQAELAAKREALERRQAELERRAPDASAPAFVPGVLDGADRLWFAARLDALMRLALRLPPPWGAPGAMSPAPAAAAINGNRLLVGQLRLAETALALRDPALLDLAAASAERLLGDLYGEQSGVANGLGDQLRELRRRLRGPREAQSAVAPRSR